MGSARRINVISKLSVGIGYIVLLICLLTNILAWWVMLSLWSFKLFGDDFMDFVRLAFSGSGWFIIFEPGCNGYHIGIVTQLTFDQRRWDSVNARIHIANCVFPKGLRFVQVQIFKLFRLLLTRFHAHEVWINRCLYVEAIVDSIGFTNLNQIVVFCLLSDLGLVLLTEKEEVLAFRPQIGIFWCFKHQPMHSIGVTLRQFGDLLTYWGFVINHIIVRWFRNGKEWFLLNLIST